MRVKLFALLLIMTSISAFALEPMKNTDNKKLKNIRKMHDKLSPMNDAPEISKKRMKRNKFFGDEIHKPEPNSRKAKVKNGIMQSVEPVLKNTPNGKEGYAGGAGGS